MNHWYPYWPYRTGTEDAFPLRIWEGLLHPLPDEAREIRLILADLDADRKVNVRQGGSIVHPEDCKEDHSLAEDLQDLIVTPRVFYLSAAQDRPPSHPRVRALLPEISERTFFGHPHLYMSGEICPLFPPDGGWDGIGNTLADYLPHISIWLVKHMVWVSMRALGRKARFIGKDDAPHGDFDRLISRLGQCWCGSGRAYRNCHKPGGIQRNVGVHTARMTLREKG